METDTTYTGDWFVDDAIQTMIKDSKNPPFADQFELWNSTSIDLVVAALTFMKSQPATTPDFSFAIQYADDLLNRFLDWYACHPVRYLNVNSIPNAYRITARSMETTDTTYTGDWFVDDAIRTMIKDSKNPPYADQFELWNSTSIDLVVAALTFMKSQPATTPDFSSAINYTDDLLNRFLDWYGSHPVRYLNVNSIPNAYRITARSPSKCIIL